MGAWGGTGPSAWVPFGLREALCSSRADGRSDALRVGGKRGARDNVKRVMRVVGRCSRLGCVAPRGKRRLSSRLDTSWSSRSLWRRRGRRRIRWRGWRGWRGWKRRCVGLVGVGQDVVAGPVSGFGTLSNLDHLASAGLLLSLSPRDLTGRIDIPPSHRVEGSLLGLDTGVGDPRRRLLGEREPQRCSLVLV